MDKILEKIGKKINEAKNIALFTHINCDCDGVGSMCALYEYLVDKNKKIAMFCDSEIPEKYKFLKYFKDINKERFLKDYDLLVSLDTATSERLGVYEKAFLEHPNTINIDHHMSNKEYGNLNFVSEKSSCGEVLFNIFNELSYKITNGMATALYGAISSDTNQFTNSNVTASTFYSAGNLLELKAKNDEVNWSLHRYKTYDQLKLAAYMASHLKFQNGISYILISLKTIKDLKVKVGDITDFLTLITNVGDSKITIVIREKDKDSYRLNMRSFGDISVNKIASKFNGGGHTNSAGCNIAGKYSKIIKDVLNECYKEIENHSNMDRGINGR